MIRRLLQRRRAAMLVAVAVSSTWSAVAMAQSALLPTMAADPTSGGAGTVVRVRSVDRCPLATTVTAARVRVYLMAAESPPIAPVDSATESDGSWSVALVVPGPPEIYTDALVVSAYCYLAEGGPNVGYRPVPFHYTGQLAGDTSAAPGVSPGGDALPNTGGDDHGRAVLGVTLSALALIVGRAATRASRL